MRQLFTLDTGDYDPKGPAIRRDSARGIILRDGKLAMVHSGKYGYCKFPGGGIEAGETNEEAMRREVLEETGLTVLPETVREYGVVHRISSSREGGIFLQGNAYYLCEAADGVSSQQLDGYEDDESFTLCFVTAAEAICMNRETIRRGFHLRVMLERENRVLDMLLAEGIIAK